MQLTHLAEKVHSSVLAVLEKEGVETLRPVQEKAIDAGLLEGKNLLVCTPTASGKTLVAELAALMHIMSQKGKAVYIVPLRALASEKFKSFNQRYGHIAKVAISSGDIDSDESYLASYDLIVCTAEKFDSLLRHHAPWIRQVSCLIVDEVHLLNDAGRGPTLEVVMTLMRHLLPSVQTIALSATIGNPRQLAAWMEAELVQDTWRPVQLKHGVYHGGSIQFD